MLGLPALLLTLDPGAGTELVDPGEAQAASESVTYQAPAGWAVVDNPEAIVLTKGSATIEITTVPFTGTPSAAYADFVTKLSEAANVTSSSDPAPASMGALDAVSGTIHFLLNGTDNTDFLTVSTDGAMAIRVAMFGPIGGLQPLQGEYDSIVASIRVSS